MLDAQKGRAKHRQDGQPGGFIKSDWALELKRLRGIKKLHDTAAHFADEKFSGSVPSLQKREPTWPAALRKPDFTEATARRTKQHDNTERPEESAWGRLERELAAVRANPDAPRAKRQRRPSARIADAVESSSSSTAVSGGGIGSSSRASTAPTHTASKARKTIAKPRSHQRRK